LAPTVPEERVKMSWVTIDRICQEKVDKEGVRSELGSGKKFKKCCGSPQG
jgi:uncharacterized protein YchJ